MNHECEQRSGEKKGKVQLRAIVFTFRIINLRVVGNGITLACALALHLGLRPNTANREADVPFYRAHGIHWGVSKRGKVRNMIPFGWHVQRSDIPGGRRGSKRSYKSSVRAGVFESFLNCKSRARAASILTRLILFFANTWPSSKYAPIFINTRVPCLLIISSTGHRK